MSFFNLAKKRKTTYSFSGKKIKPRIINSLLETARWAPSCSNSQPWNFVVVSDQKQIESLMSTVNYGFFHTDPPIIIAIILRSKFCSGKGHACFRGKDSGVHDSFMSCGVAASYLTLAAADLGIGSCILTPEQNKVKKFLKVKKEDAVPLLVGLGYSDNKSVKTKRERRPLNDLVYYDYFGVSKNGKTKKESKT